jgi:quercetin dioxygenase-like cupin family protein
VEAIEVLSRKFFSEEKMLKVNLFETENLFCDLYCIRPGQAQKAHTHSGADKIYFVLEGEATVRVGEEERVLSAGQIVLAPSEIVHGLKNAGQENLGVLVIMAPNPNARNKSSGGQPRT